MEIILDEFILFKNNIRIKKEKLELAGSGVIIILVVMVAIEKTTCSLITRCSFQQCSVVKSWR